MYILYIVIHLTGMINNVISQLIIPPAVMLNFQRHNIYIRCS